MIQKEIRVLMVEPGMHPRVTVLQNDLDSLQKAVSEFCLPRWQVVGEGHTQHPELDGWQGQVRSRNPASSPASPTKETVERLSLFLSVHPSQPR